MLRTPLILWTLTDKGRDPVTLNLAADGVITWILSRVRGLVTWSCDVDFGSCSVRMCYNYHNIIIYYIIRVDSDAHASTVSLTITKCLTFEPTLRLSLYIPPPRPWCTSGVHFNRHLSVRHGIAGMDIDHGGSCPRFKGAAKCCGYQYPGAMIDVERQEMIVSYSIGKEDIALTVFSLGELA
jgi:hypothetical protein